MIRNVPPTHRRQPTGTYPACVVTAGGATFTLQGRSAEVMIRVAAHIYRNRASYASGVVGGFRVDLTQGKVLIQRTESDAPIVLTTPPEERDEPV